MSGCTSRKFTEEFIAEYRRHECLWKLKDKDYKNNFKKSLAYEELRKLCAAHGQPATVDFVKSKINNLKTAFNREFKKLKYSTECSGEDVYEPKLFYFNLMLFTVDQEEPRQSMSSAFDDESDYSSHEEVSYYYFRYKFDCHRNRN